MTIIDLIVIVIIGLMVIGNGFLVGWLVYRAQRGPYEPLIAPKITRTGAVNLDEFAETQEPSALSPTQAANITRMNELMGIDVLKGGGGMS